MVRIEGGVFTCAELDDGHGARDGVLDRGGGEVLAESPLPGQYVRTTRIKMDRPQHRGNDHRYVHFVVPIIVKGVVTIIIVVIIVYIAIPE